MKKIPLTKGFETKVDDSDYEMLMKNKWCVSAKGKSGGMYAYSRRGPMSRVIMGVTDPKVFVDHINHDTMDNRRSNLRLVTNSQNSANLKRKVIGAYFNKNAKKWNASIRIDGTRVFLGYYSTQRQANAAYKLANARRY